MSAKVSSQLVSSSLLGNNIYTIRLDFSVNFSEKSCLGRKCAYVSSIADNVNVGYFFVGLLLLGNLVVRLLLFRSGFYLLGLTEIARLSIQCTAELQCCAVLTAIMLRSLLGG